LVKEDTSPYESKEYHKGNFEYNRAGFGENIFSCSYIFHDRQKDGKEQNGQNPQGAEQDKGKALVETSPVYDFECHERKHDDRTKDDWQFQL